eukprot:1159445-Pelagomonas_calceolata.AAC.1
MEAVISRSCARRGLWSHEGSQMSFRHYAAGTDLHAPSPLSAHYSAAGADLHASSPACVMFCRLRRVSMACGSQPGTRQALTSCASQWTSSCSCHLEMTQRPRTERMSRGLTRDGKSLSPSSRVEWAFFCSLRLLSRCIEKFWRWIFTWYPHELRASS